MKTNYTNISPCFRFSDYVAMAQIISKAEGFFWHIFYITLTQPTYHCGLYNYKELIFAKNHKFKCRDKT